MSLDGKFFWKFFFPGQNRISPRKIHKNTKSSVFEIFWYECGGNHLKTSLVKENLKNSTPGPRYGHFSDFSQNRGWLQEVFSPWVSGNMGGLGWKKFTNFFSNYIRHHEQGTGQFFFQKRPMGVSHGTLVGPRIFRMIWRAPAASPPRGGAPPPLFQGVSFALTHKGIRAQRPLFCS